MRNQKSKSEHEYPAIRITIDISSDTNRKLSLSAKRSGRAKRQEAGIRLSDHLDSFIDISTDAIQLSKQQLEPDAEYPAISITVDISSETNRKLSLSAKRWGRAKRQEAVIRLDHHLDIITDIATEGKRFLR